MNEGKRLLYYDYIKAFLIFFVVLGHAVDSFGSNTAYKVVYLFIYTFHMPLFIFISGFFSKWKLSKFLAYFLMYFIFTIVQVLLNVFIISPLTTYTFLKIVNMFINPLWGLWFLLALPIWILSIKFIKEVKLWHIIVSVCLTLIIGFVPFIGSNLSLSRIFYFFPFFLMGRWCKQNEESFNNFLQKLQKKSIKIISVLIFILTLVIIILLINYMPKSYFYGKNAYSNPFDLVNRIISIIVGVITGLAVMAIIPYKNEGQSKFSNYISNIGQKTLSIYLFHIIILLLFKEFCVPYLNLHWGINIGISTLLSVIIVILTSTKPFVKSVNLMLNCFTRRKANEKRN